MISMVLYIYPYYLDRGSSVIKSILIQLKDPIDWGIDSSRL